MNDIYQHSKHHTIGREKGPEITGYEDLANAIVLKAVRDYQHALVNLHKNPYDSHAESRKKECIRFFNSEWCKMLTSIDGDKLESIAREQIIERDYRRFYIGYDD